MCAPVKSPGVDSGVTLLELLVGLGLLALLASLLLQGVDAAGHLWNGAAQRSATAEAIAGAQDVLRQRMELAFFETQYNAIPPYPGFVGSEDRITFFAPSGLRHGPGASKHYNLSVDADGDLVLASRSDLWGNLPERMSGPPEVEVLLRGVQTLEVDYFETDASGFGGRWLRAWQNKPVPPALVRIRVAFPPRDSRWWPELIVKPVATVDTDCALARDVGQCAGRG